MTIPLKDGNGLVQRFAGTGSGTEADPYLPNAGNGGGPVFVATSFTRPSNGNTYDAKDALNATSPAVLSFTGAARIAGAGGYIVSAKLTTSKTACVARFRLHLYHTAPTAIADETTQSLLIADDTKRIGIISFDACQTEGGTSTGAWAQWGVDDAKRLFFVSGASTTIYGLLETLDSFVADSAQTFRIELGIEQL
jgi:hypothetical protein